MFDVSLQDLLIPQDVLLGELANEPLRELTETGRQLQASISAYQDVLSRLSAFVEDGETFHFASQSVTSKLAQFVDEVGDDYQDAVDRIYGMDEFGTKPREEQSARTKEN